MYQYHTTFSSSLSPAVCATSNAGSTVTYAVHGPCTRTVQHRLCKPLLTPAVLAWCIGNWEYYTGCKFQYQQAQIHPSSFQCCACSSHLSLPSKPHYPQRRATRITHRRSSTRPKKLDAHFLKDPNLPYPTCPCSLRPGCKHAVGKQETIGLDGVIDHSGGFRRPQAAREATHPRQDPAPAVTVVETECPTDALPIL